MKCEICNTSYDKKELYTLSFGEFDIKICHDCGFVADELLAAWLKKHFKTIETDLQDWKELLKKEQD